MSEQETAVRAALTIGGTLVYHVIRGNVECPILSLDLCHGGPALSGPEQLGAEYLCAPRYCPSHVLSLLSDTDSEGGLEVIENEAVSATLPLVTASLIPGPEGRCITDEQRTLIERLLCERLSLCGICRAVGVSLTWLLHFLVECFRACPDTLYTQQPYCQPKMTM
jgi:hypothetical protein